MPPSSGNSRDNEDQSKDFRVALTILKHTSQWEGLSHILWKIKHVPNHQPDMYIYIYIHICIYYIYNPMVINGIYILYIYTVCIILVVGPCKTSHFCGATCWPRRVVMGLHHLDGVYGHNSENDVGKTFSKSRSVGEHLPRLSMVFARYNRYIELVAMGFLLTNAPT